MEPIETEKDFPIQCRQCEGAPCLDACPAGTLYRDSEGLVMVYDHRCIACWMCIMGCPFGAPKPFRYSKKMMKCDRCKGMDAPYCVESCPTRALMLVDLEEIARGKWESLKMNLGR
jgi:carbon-monoxide dehydrogenase iron sulfur subunit